MKTSGKYLQGFDLHLILQTEFNQFSSEYSKTTDNQTENMRATTIVKIKGRRNH